MYITIMIYSIIQHPVGMVYLNGGAIIANENGDEAIQDHFDTITIK